MNLEGRNPLNKINNNNKNNNNKNQNKENQCPLNLKFKIMKAKVHNIERKKQVLQQLLHKIYLLYQKMILYKYKKKILKKGGYFLWVEELPIIMMIINL